MKSAPGEGSTFYASIPMMYKSAVPVIEPTWDVNPRLAPILLVEDSIEIRLLYEKYLKNSAYQLLAAASLRQARHALEHFRPAALILDVMLQGEDTWAFLGEIKSQDSTRDIPVIVQTVVEDAEKAAALGADAFLMKPLDRELLLKELTRLVGA